MKYDSSGRISLDDVETSHRHVKFLMQRKEGVGHGAKVEHGLTKLSASMKLRKMLLKGPGRVFSVEMMMSSPVDFGQVCG